MDDKFLFTLAIIVVVITLIYLFCKCKDEVKNTHVNTENFGDTSKTIKIYNHLNSPININIVTPGEKELSFIQELPPHANTVEKISNVKNLVEGGKIIVYTGLTTSPIPVKLYEYSVKELGDVIDIGKPIKTLDKTTHYNDAKPSPDTISKISIYNSTHIPLLLQIAEDKVLIESEEVVNYRGPDDFGIPIGTTIKSMEPFINVKIDDYITHITY